MSKRPKADAGVGSIRQRPSGHYQAQIMLGGKRYTKTFAKKTDAGKWVRDLRAQHEANTLPRDPNITVQEFLRRWLEGIRPPVVRERTWDDYESELRRNVLPKHGARRLVDLTGERLQEIVADRLQQGVSTATVRRLHNILHAALEQAVKWTYLARNPADSVQLPERESGERPAWTPEQARTFLAGTADDRLHTLYTLALYTALRIGELCGLLWCDVDLEAGTLRVCRNLQKRGKSWIKGKPKSKRGERTVPLASSALWALRRWRTQQREEWLGLGLPWGDDTPVFTMPDGGQVGRPHVYGKFQRASKALGLPVMPLHSTRHTAASLMINEGVPLAIVQAILGHATISQTADCYGHITPASTEQATRALESALTGK